MCSSYCCLDTVWPDDTFICLVFGHIKFAKIISKFCQIRYEPVQNGQSFIPLSQGDKISTNLVTLLGHQKMVREKDDRFGVTMRERERECDQIWRNFATLAKLYKSLAYFLFGKMLNLLWQICDIIGLIFIVAHGQILKNNIAIWSHWSKWGLKLYCFT